MSSINEGTVFSSLLSCAHGRERRDERGINKVDLQRARKYGMMEYAHKGRLKYTYGGIVFIYDQIRQKEITSFHSRDLASTESGTKIQKPILLKKNDAYEGSRYLETHKCYKRQILNDKMKWTSHSIFIVDMSGSMRRDDVNGARCRSDAVWMVLARDFVRPQLEMQAVTGWDVVSIIIMRDRADVMLRYEPLDWILYNTLIEMKEWSFIRPCGPGNYLPALERAEELLSYNSIGSCALSLTFFSDGKPSDHGPFIEKMGEIASQYRRRLTFSCIGMALEEDGETFETLHRMVCEADAYGAKSTLKKPSLDVTSLSTVVGSVLTSLTSTKSEITDLATGAVRVVRQDVRSERRGAEYDLSPTDEWRLYSGRGGKMSVGRVWSWSPEEDDFVRLLDPRCAFCAKELTEQSSMQCTSCRVSEFCIECSDSIGQHMNSSNCRDSQKLYLSGKIASTKLPSFSVAIKVPIFGEGAERIVRRFRFIDQAKNFIGPKMVAKESRFVDDYLTGRAFHANFLRTQARASAIASMFNEKLNRLQHVLGKRCVDKMPRIEFLNPMVVEVFERDESLRPSFVKKHILVEPFLPGDFEKFNSNNGFVKGQNHDFGEPQLSEASLNARRKYNDLDMIEEGSEESDSDDEIYDHVESSCSDLRVNDVTDNMIPQAFSHFSFEVTRNSVVVDLQGVLLLESDGARKYLLTDPAIHKKWVNRGSKSFGRTNLGKRGIQAFFRTHICNEACRLLGLQIVDPVTLKFQQNLGEVNTASK